MENIEADLRDLFQNRSLAVPVNGADVLGDGADYIPTVKENVGYIVCAVLLNTRGEVLMKQEAKKGRKGKWYLPAGKVKANESLEEAVKREVHEDTGYDFVPTTLLAVECGSGAWYRFTFTGTITGGCMKTQADEEQSLQARWFIVQDVKDQIGLRLRSDDLMPLLDAAVAYKGQISSHPNTLPVVKSHERLLYRLVLVYKEPDGDKASVLVNTDVVPHFPVTAISKEDNWISLSSHKILKAAFDREDIRTQSHGLLSVEYCGQQGYNNDGMCFTCLVSIDDLRHVKNEHFKWCELQNEDVKTKLVDKTQIGSTVVFMDVL